MQLFSADPTLFSKKNQINFLPTKTLKNWPKKLLIIRLNLFFTVQPSSQPKIDFSCNEYVPRAHLSPYLWWRGAKEKHKALMHIIAFHAIDKEALVHISYIGCWVLINSYCLKVTAVKTAHVHWHRKWLAQLMIFFSFSECFAK